MSFWFISNIFFGLRGNLVIIFITIVETGFCTLDVSQTASYEITAVCPSVCLSFHPSVTKFSQDWIISFFLILYMMITYHGFSWLAKPDFWKKKKMAARIWVQNEFFAILLNLDHTFSLKLHTVIACNHS